ncbi:TolC family protein [Hymenobacter sp. CRA2]|uniref:TolC family protein n=1 Tax=Hymenobacter sp. CRA2 TaxID=1955620 RepID=UPI0015901278|nr:TolC family protein [Hymenobacter sp. CRA2]
MVSLLLFATYPLSAQTPPTAQPLTLQQAWQQAEVHNHDIELQRRQVGISEELVQDRAAQRLPKVEAGGEYAYLAGLYAFEPNAGLHHGEAVPVPPGPHAYNVHLDASLNLYSGGRVKKQIEEQHLSAEVETERLHLTQNDVRLRVALAYLDLQRNLANQQLADNSIRESEKRLRQIQALFRRGVVLRSDVLRAELQHSRQQLLLTEIKNNITLANQRLNLLLGAPEEQLNQPAPEILPTGGPAVPTDYAASAAQAQQAPELKIAGLQTKISENKLEQTEAAKKPHVGAFAEYGYTYPNRLVFPNVAQIYSIGQVGVRVGYDLSAHYIDRHAEKAAALTVQRQQVAEQAALDRKKEEVNTAYVRYQETQERIRVAEQSIRQAAENYRIVNSTYFNQLALLTDLLDADNQLLQARIDLVTAQTQAAAHYYQLQKALGQL